jgi:hypothetical protein
MAAGKGYVIYGEKERDRYSQEGRVIDGVKKKSNANIGKRETRINVYKFSGWVRSSDHGG